MRIEITAGGIYGADGKEIEIGSVHDVQEEPTAWAGRYRVLGGKSEGEKTAVTNPADKPEPVGPFEAKDLGGGWWAIHDSTGAEVGKKLRKDDAEAFNGLSDEDKTAYLAEA